MNERRDFLICNSKKSKYCTHTLLIAENSCCLWHDTASPGNQILILQGSVLSSSSRVEMSKNYSWAFQKDAMISLRVKIQLPYPVMQYHIPEQNH
jgi:hypothetical protein